MTQPTPQALSNVRLLIARLHEAGYTPTTIYQDGEEHHPVLLDEFPEIVFDTEYTGVFFNNPEEGLALHMITFIPFEGSPAEIADFSVSTRFPTFHRTVEKVLQELDPPTGFSVAQPGRRLVP
jgi:hypothetical protein